MCFECDFGTNRGKLFHRSVDIEFSFIVRDFPILRRNEENVCIYIHRSIFSSHRGLDMPLKIITVDL